MFGAFPNGWQHGLSDLSERVQKLKTGLEAGLQDSGLLGPGEAPAQAEQTSTAEGAAGSGEGSQAGGGQVAGVELEQNAEPATVSTSDPVESGQGRWHGDWTSEREGSTAKDSVAKQGHEGAFIEAESGWDENDLGLEVPEIDLPEDRNGAAAAVPSALPDSEHASLSLPGDPQPSEQAQSVHEAPLEAEGGQLVDLAAGSRSIPADGTPQQQLQDAEVAQASSSTLPNGVTHHLDDLTQPAGGPETDSLHPSQASAPLPDELVNGADELVNGAVSEDGRTDQGEEDGHADEEDEGGHAGQDNTAVLDQPPETQPRPPQGQQQEGKSEEEIRSMPLEEVQAWAVQLQAALQAREVQLKRKFEEVANMHDVTQQLMARNEELARKAAKASEEDIKTLTDEYEARLGAAERKVYALSKERDMLKRGTEKLSSATETLKEKDNIIAQVMAEGEQLSKKQLAQESTIKKLRQQLQAAELSRKEFATEVTLERQKLGAAAAARQKAEGDLAAARLAHRTELDAEKAHYEALLAKSRAAQVEAENRAAASAKEGLSRKLKEAELRAEMLAEQVADLQMSMERQRATADAREDMLKRELADMERRNQEAEARHEDLTGTLPDATRPLLRQIEGMQRTAAAHAQAWQMAEQALQSRLNDAEARAAAAAEKERLATERLQSAHSRVSSHGAALDALREECANLQSRSSAVEDELQSSKQRCHRLEEQLSQLQARTAAAEAERLDAEREAAARIKEERQASLRALAAAESRALALEESLKLSPGTSAPSAAAKPAAGEPPAMAGPGFKWVLLREGEDAAAAQRQRDDAGPSSRDSFYGGASSRATAPELERLRDGLQQKEEQLASYHATIAHLEATRDSLAEELVSLSQTAEQHASAWRELERTRQQHAQTQQKLAACTELLGEREERLLELEADIADVKALYKEQIEFVLEQLSASRSPSAAASSVSSWVPAPDR